MNEKYILLGLVVAVICIIAKVRKDSKAKAKRQQGAGSTFKTSTVSGHNKTK